MATFSFLDTPSAVLDPTSSGRKGGYVDKTKRRGIGRNKVLKYLILLISFATANADMEGLDIKKNNERPMSLTDGAKQLDEVSRNQLRGNLNPSEAVSQDKDILVSLLGHMQTLQEQVKDGGDDTAVALMLGSVIEDAHSAAELMSGDGNEYALESNKLNARELQESIKGMAASQLRAMADEFVSKIEEMIRSTQDGLNIVKEAERSISNVRDSTRYHRRASKSNEQSDFNFGDHDDTTDWKTFKNGGYKVPSVPTLSKYGKRNYVKMPKLKLAEKLRKLSGNQSRRLRLQDRDECQPECKVEDFDCNCRRLFSCTNKLDTYDFALLYVGGFVDEDPNSDFFATFGENSLNDIDLFYAESDLSSKIEDIQSLTNQGISRDNCYAVLQELHSACKPGETCTSPNSQSFQLSTEKVCSSVNSRIKLRISTIGDFYDFRNGLDNLVCPATSFDSCSEFVMALENLYDIIIDKPQPQSATVFISSETYTGDLGGISGANTKCQELADEAGLDGLYKAWIASSQGDGPFTLFDPKSPLPFKLPDGTVVANDWDDLTSGRLRHPINMDENKQELSLNDPVFAWSMVPLTGTNNRLFCNDWKTSEVENGGGVGAPVYWQGNTVTIGWWSQATFLTCNQRHHLYCFEQPWGESYNPDLYNPMRKIPTYSVEPVSFNNVQFPIQFARLRTPQGVESIQGYRYQSLSSNPNDLYCDAKLGPPRQLNEACDKSMEVLIGNETSIGMLLSIVETVNDPPTSQFIPPWVTWYLSLVDEPAIERNREFMDYYLNITDPKNGPGWFDWYLSLRDDSGFVLPNPNGGTYFCNDQEILDDPFSSATLRNCQEAWLYDNIANPYTSKYEAISYPDDPDLLPFNNTNCSAFPTCQLEWLDTSSNPFSDDDTSEAVVYNEETDIHVCAESFPKAERDCLTNVECPDTYTCPSDLTCYPVSCPGSGQPQQQPTNRPTIISTTRVPTPDINKEGCGLFFDYCRQLKPQLNQCQRFWDVCRHDLVENYPYWKYPLPNCTDSTSTEDIVTCPEKWLYEEDNPYGVDKNEACYNFFDTCREEASALDLNYFEYPLDNCEDNQTLTCKEEWLYQEVSPYSEDGEEDPACDSFWNYCRDQLIIEHPRWYWPLPEIPTSFELLPGYCCLDTPSNEEYFGSTYNPDLNMKCQNDGPLHTWLSPDPCTSANGQWLRNPCHTLQRCIDNRPTKDDPDFNEQFEDWVQDEELDIYNTHDQEQCSQTRVALGYDENYLDDKAVCETFKEIKCDPFYDDLAFLADGADDGPKKFVQVVYDKIEYDPDKPLIFTPLPDNDGWMIPELVTVEEGGYIRALKASHTALSLYLDNQEKVSEYVEKVNNVACKQIPAILFIVGVSTPNILYVICQVLALAQIILGKTVKTAIKISKVAVETTLDKITPDPVEEIDTNKYIETIYENMMSFDDWTYFALEITNKNLNDQHFQMRTELQDRHQAMVNDVNQYNNCMSNFLGIQIYDALPGVTAERLSPRCSSLLGLDPNRRLAEQSDDLPFSLDVDFGPKSFPNQISQVLVKEDEIKETQQTMMATEAEILIDMERIQVQANDIYNNQQVMMDTLSNIQKELDIDHKDSKSKQSKKAKGEKAEEARDDESDLFERRLLASDGLMIKEMVEQIASSVKEVKTEVKESIDEVKTSVHIIDDKVARMKEKVEKIERSIEDIKEMLSQLIMKG